MRFFLILKQVNETGQRTRKKLLKGLKYHNLTVEQMAYKYEPESKEKSEAYCKCIVKRSGLERSRILDSLNDEEFDRLLQAMQNCEGWEVGKEKYYPLKKNYGYAPREKSLISIFPD